MLRALDNPAYLCIMCRVFSGNDEMPKFVDDACDFAVL